MIRLSFGGLGPLGESLGPPGTPGAFWRPLGGFLGASWWFFFEGKIGVEHRYGRLPLSERAVLGACRGHFCSFGRIWSLYVLIISSSFLVKTMCFFILNVFFASRVDFWPQMDLLGMPWGIILVSPWRRRCCVGSSGRRRHQKVQFEVIFVVPWGCF